MSSENFVKVFDVLDSGFKNWSFSASGLIFIVIGLVIFFVPKIIKSTNIPYLDSSSELLTGFGYFFLSFAILWTFGTFFLTYAQYHHHQVLAKENGFLVVEGPVENFIPMPYSGHAEESFIVSGVRFSYSDFIITDGFNNTSSHGGPINKNSYVRISYDPSGNTILRLEIRDFKGQMNDYSKTESLFPTSKDVVKNSEENSIRYLSWFGYVLIVFYLLDFIALMSFYIPYFRTYFRIMPSAVANCLIPKVFENGKKAKLRNSLIYWDKERKEIWLRPRGLNFFQVQLMVAKLNVDEASNSIISQEIRYSSVYPVIMVLFLLAIYEAASGKVTFFGLIGIAAVCAVLGYANLKNQRNRMEKIVQDAISEIREM